MSSHLFSPLLTSSKLFPSLLTSSQLISALLTSSQLFSAHSQIISVLIWPKTCSKNRITAPNPQEDSKSMILKLLKSKFKRNMESAKNE
jgi:hypothetical protein